jgi:hypothetical protein
MKYSLDGEDCVKANEVSQGQRAHGDISTELQGLINIFNGADTFIESLDSFVDIGN